MCQWSISKNCRICQLCRFSESLKWNKTWRGFIIIQTLEKCQNPPLDWAKDFSGIAVKGGGGDSLMDGCSLADLRVVPGGRGPEY